MKRQLVFHHQTGDRQTGVIAVIQQRLGGFKRIRDVNIAAGVFTEMGFIDDKSAADGIVGIAVDLFIAAPGGNAHGVFMQRQIVALKTHAVVFREIHFMAALSQQQALAGFNIADKRRDAVNINGIR